MSRSLTKFFAFILVAGFALSAFAQDESNIIRPITKSGSAAFVFNISGLGAFGPTAPPIGSVGGTFPVAGLGLKYYLSDDLAAKVLLAFATTDDGRDSLGTTSTAFGIGATVEMHFGPLYSTSPYAGLGIRFASGSQTTDIGGTDTDAESSATQLSIMAVAGFDWFFTRGIAIGTEWGLGYTMTSTDDGVDATDEPSSSSIGIGMTNATGGLSGSGSVHAVVYF
jgi:hypothetical protein